MSAYDDAVIADNPVAYWKCEELAPPPPVPNTSLDDFVGTFDGSLQPNSAGGLIQGITGPIVTDGTSYGMSGGIARIPPLGGVNGTDLQIDNDQTWEVWFKHVSVPGPSGAAATISTFMNRGSSTTGTYLSTGERSTGLFADQLYWSLLFKIDTVFTVFVLKSCIIPRDLNIWYCGQGVRQGTSMKLYLNGWLVASRNDLPVGPIDTNGNNPWRLGYIANTVFGQVSRSQGQSHVALYNTPLTQAKLRAHIVAALGSLPSNPCGDTPTISVGCPDGTGTVGEAYSSNVTVTGGTVPYTYAVIVGSLPTGLSLNASTGAITGTPTVAGTFSFTIRVTDNDGLTGTTPGCGIIIDETPPPPTPGTTVRAFTFDGNPTDSGVRSHYWLAIAPTDSGDELRSKVIKAVRVTGKVTNASAKVYKWDVGEPIDVAKIEAGTDAATRPQEFPDVPQVTQSARKQVNVPNVVLSSVRVEGTWEGDEIKDRLDEITIEQAKQGVRR